MAPGTTEKEKLSYDNAARMAKYHIRSAYKNNYRSLPNTYSGRVRFVQMWTNNKLVQSLLELI